MTDNERNDTIVAIKTTVEDMHHRLFGNGQPGVVQVYNERINELEADRNKFLGAIKLVRYVAVILPLLVLGAEGYRVWTTTQSVQPTAITAPRSK